MKTMRMFLEVIIKLIVSINIRNRTRHGNGAGFLKANRILTRLCITLVIHSPHSKYEIYR